MNTVLIEPIILKQDQSYLEQTFNFKFKKMKKRYIYKGFAILLFASLGFSNIGCTGDYIGDVQNTGTFDADNYFLSYFSGSGFSACISSD